jgi:ribonucleoside-diphosphate reductase alpha chain
MKIRKRSGRLANLDISNVRKQTKPSTEGLDNVSFEELELSANISFTDGMDSSDIQKTLIQTAFSKVDVDKPNWSFVAARLLNYDLFHTMARTYNTGKIRDCVYKAISLKNYFEKAGKYLSYSTDGFDIARLQSAIEPDRDNLLTGLAAQTLQARYLLTVEDEILELPQIMFMSIAMFHASVEKPSERTSWALKFYDVMSKLLYLPATPTLSNGRKINGNCMSCAVGSTPDSLTGIFEAYSEQAEGSKHGTGFGWDWTRVRALGGKIGNTRNAAGGLVPWLKIENDIAIAVDQLGVRSGAIAVYVETWHKDYMDFLDMKRNSGEENRLTKELFIGSSISDIFMERVIANEDWVMFDPYDTPDLPEIFGEEFSNAYKKYEKRFLVSPDSFTNRPTVVKAKALWKKMQKYYFETGMPFIFFKDNANNAHENPELGIIRSTNLCTEIFQAADENKTILCNLGSINLAKVHTEEQMAYVVPIATRMLDNIIDLNYYAIPKSEDNQKQTRAIGLGIAGEAELLANSQIMYGSKAHLEFIDTLYERFARYSNQASIDLGIERGTWSPESPYRNAYRRAIAPTSSIGILLGTSACHDAVFEKVWVEDNKLGNIKVTAPGITPHNYAFYINAYDVDQEDAVRATAIRQKHFDQGISHNFYFRPGVKGKKVFDTLILAWKLGMKSGYYLRSDSPKLAEEDLVRDTEIACFGCGG